MSRVFEGARTAPPSLGVSYRVRAEPPIADQRHACFGFIDRCVRQACVRVQIALVLETPEASDLRPPAPDLLQRPRQREPRVSRSASPSPDGSAPCVSCGGKYIEDAVGQQIRHAIDSTAIDAAIEAARRADERHRQERDALRLEVEHARYDAGLAGASLRTCGSRHAPRRVRTGGAVERALERVRGREARLAAFKARTIPSSMSPQSSSPNT